MPWYFLLIGFIVVIGIINAYNFMDGINGITACYSLALGLLLMIVNTQFDFIDPDFLRYAMLALLVFTFFNFRAKAKCFAGDVGSVSIAYILVFALGLLILKSGNLIYILFLAVYGVDTIWTIVQRLVRKENIFEGHRTHLYQYLANEVGMNKLLVSFLYGLLQLGIGYVVIQMVDKSFSIQLAFAISLLSLLSVFYLLGKSYIVKTYVGES